MMVFLATLIGFGIGMALMAAGLMLGRGRIEHGCGQSCECLQREQKGLRQ